MELPAILLIALLALGAAGLYLAMPGGRHRLGGIALVLLAAAAGAFIALSVQFLTGGATIGWFSALSLVGLIGAVRMITHRKPVYSALYFIMVIVAVTGLLVLMQATFLAASLMIIYAGAILVTYLFVIMLAQQDYSPGYDTQAREPFWGCVCGFVLLAVLAGRLFFFDEPPDTTVVPLGDADGAPEYVGIRLLTNYVVAIQLAGVLLLAALVGAIAIARRRVTDLPEGDLD
ncbi:MAG: NADH-quinone oxidoreductase subunit J [Planctomycetota bacterium]